MIWPEFDTWGSMIYSADVITMTVVFHKKLSEKRFYQRFFSKWRMFWCNHFTWRKLPIIYQYIMFWNSLLYFESIVSFYSQILTVKTEVNMLYIGSCDTEKNLNPEIGLRHLFHTTIFRLFTIANPLVSGVH